MGSTRMARKSGSYPAKAEAQITTRSWSSESKLLRGELGSNDSGGDLCKCGLPRRRSVIAEGAESAVVGSSQALEGNEFGGFENPVTDFLGSLDAWIDRIDDPHEDLLIRLAALAD